MDYELMDDVVEMTDAAAAEAAAVDEAVVDEDAGLDNANADSEADTKVDTSNHHDDDTVVVVDVERCHDYLNFECHWNRCWG